MRPHQEAGCLFQTGFFGCSSILDFALRRDGCWVRYGASRARPFARRRFNTRRPALVAMRARKPWVRARLILLGWNVRFMTFYLGHKSANNGPYF